MNATVDGFCRDLLEEYRLEEYRLEEHRRGRRHHPETVAARFVECFGVSLRPSLEELRTLLREGGFGEVEEMGMADGPRGLHVGVAGEACHIYYQEQLWQGARDYTVLHETYEIMHETLCEMDTGAKPEREVCREADRFAAAVLMQPGEFRILAEASGLDVIALQREYRYAYAAVALRLTEVVRALPYFVVLYERPGRSDPAGWPKGDDLTALRATVVKRKNGMGPPASRLITGKRGGIPQRHRRVPSGSLAERAAHTGRTEYAEDGGLAVVARPVHWKGHLAKLAVVAVPGEYRSVLEPQSGRRGRRSPSRGCSRRRAAAP